MKLPELEGQGREIANKFKKIIEKVICENYEEIQKLIDKGQKFAEDKIFKLIFGAVFSQCLFWKFLVIIIVALIIKKGLEIYCKSYLK